VKLEPQEVRLIKPEEYGPLRVEHLYEGDNVSYLLKGSSMTEDGRLPTRKQWLWVLNKKEGAQYDPYSGKLIIPVFDQESANDIHTALLPIIAQGLDELHDPLVWPHSPETHIPVTELNDGTYVIEEGRYGKLTLQHALSGRSKSRVRHMVYIIGGRRTENGRFPGIPGWNWLLYQSGLGHYQKSSRRWKFTLNNPEKNRKINKLLIALLKESILSWHSVANQSKTNQIAASIRSKLESMGVDPDNLGDTDETPEVAAAAQNAAGD